MSGYDFLSRSVVHIGSVTKNGAAALAVAIIAMTAPAMAAAPESTTPIVRVAPMPSRAEIAAQIDSERHEAQIEAQAEHNLRKGYGEREEDARYIRINNKLKNNEETIDAFSAAVSARAMEIGHGTCFGGFLNSMPNSLAVEQSTVMVRVVNINGDTIATGSAFIVHDSAMPGEKHNRLATAGHVVNPDDLNLGEGRPKLSHFEIYSSKGVLLGVVQKVAAGTPPGKTVVSEILPDGDFNYNLKPDDWAVLKIDTTKTSKNALIAFDSIIGLELAKIQAPVKTVGLSGDSSHPAISSGASGGPLVDQLGHVHGVISAGGISQYMRKTLIPNLLSPLTINKKDGDLSESRTRQELFRYEKLIPNPLGEPALLEALGRAGMNISISTSSATYSGKNKGLMAVGMSEGMCTSSPTIQGPIGPLGQMISNDVSSVPAPLDRIIAKDGSVMMYDQDGALDEVRLKNGDVHYYYEGKIISENRVDGLIIEYELGKIAREVLPDGVIVSYEDGIASTKISIDGTVTPITQEAHNVRGAYGIRGAYHQANATYHSTPGRR